MACLRAVGLVLACRADKALLGLLLLLLQGRGHRLLVLVLLQLLPEQLLLQVLEGVSGGHGSRHQKRVGGRQAGLLQLQGGREAKEQVHLKGAVRLGCR